MRGMPTTGAVAFDQPHMALLAPDTPPHYLARRRLLAQLDAAARGPVALVSAPAGWGKTVVLSGWARTRAAAGRTAWLTADGEDAPRFWYRMRAALAETSAVDPDPMGQAATECGLSDVIEALDAVGEAVTIIVDDCDRIPDGQVFAGLEYLVRVMNGRLRLVLGCRTDPPLPLHRWRVSGEIGELRADQLAFTVAETRELLAEYAVSLPETVVTELHAVTEGWAAGLRLAALAMSDHPEPEQVVADLGVHDQVLDYLTAEVLSQLPPDVCRLLLDVSVAEHVTAGLVQALTGRVDGARVLADLQRRGAFVRRCGGPGEWYCFHPLFSRALYAELSRQHPQRALEAHRRAAGWYSAHGPPVEALRHLLAAQEWHAAVELLRRHWPDVVVGTRRRSLRDMMVCAPGPVHSDPLLAMAFAAERLDAGDPVRVRRFLRLAEDGANHVPRDQRPSVAMMAGFRAAEARLSGDMYRVREAASHLLAAAPAGDLSPAPTEAARALGLSLLGTANLHLGETKEAGPRLRDGLSQARQLDLDQAQVFAGSQLAAWYAFRGRLRAAVRTGREALAVADRLGLTHVSDLGWARMAMAEAYYQWDRLGEARRMTEETVSHACGDSLLLIAAAILQAKLRLAAGQLAYAHEALTAAKHEAMRVQVGRTALRAIHLVEAELRLAGGDLTAARRRLSTWRDEEPSSAWAAVIEASILLAEGRAAAAAAAVAPYLATADAASSLTWIVRAGVVTALAGNVLGDRDRVTRGLDVALEAAEEEGFRRVFTAAGHALRELIDAVAPTMAVYRPVVAELAEAPNPVSPSPPVPPGMSERQGAFGHLVEPLTERELTVLRYLQGTLSNVEIASVLYVSVNTIKTHVKNIYRKLNAGRRREAVRRARDLRLL
jgi:LuxR family transcriptional regulator, maltose regulon positive regulatory protein